MARTFVAGSGTCVPPNLVTNQMLSRIMDTSDEWIRERSGIETRYYADLQTATSDLAVAAAAQALEMAEVPKESLNLVIFATMTPDHFFPGSGSLLQSKLGIPTIPCFDIRQQCAGFIYGLQLADAYVKAGMAETILLVGAEIHTGFMPWSLPNFEYMYGRSDIPPTSEEYAWNSRFRHLTVLFGDGAAALVLRAGSDPARGIIDSILHTDGTNHDKLHVPGVGSSHRPYVDTEQLRRGDHIPVMDGRFVFRAATTAMIEVSRRILSRNGFSVEDLSLVLMHQANMRINEYVQKALNLPDAKVIHNIQRYGNTTAASIPLLWDEGIRCGRIRPGDLVLMVAFGAGLNWGAALMRA
jgi:3-oxoacyl-[acyl-carrier-protein] synthase III